MPNIDLRLGDNIQIMTEIKEGTVDLIITSPPYNCRKDYGIVSDEVPWPEYYHRMEKFLHLSYRCLCDGGTLAINVPGVIRYQHDHKYANTWSDFDHKYKTHRGSRPVVGRGRIEPLGFNIFSMMSKIDSHVREPIIWVKGSRPGNEIVMNNAMGSDSNPYLRAAHEFILLGSKKRWYHRGGTGRRGEGAVPFQESRKDVWYIPPAPYRDHAASFPVEIPARLIEIFIHAKDAIVLDPYMGRGTTGIACVGAGIDFIGIDVDPSSYNTAKLNIEGALNA